MSFLESLESVAASFKIFSFFCAIASSIFNFFFFLNQGLDTLLLAVLRSLNSASKILEVRGYLSVRWNTPPLSHWPCTTCVLRCFAKSQFCKKFASVFFTLNHQWSVDSLLLCSCVVLISWWFQWIQNISVFLYEIDSVGLLLVTSPSIVASPLSLTLRMEYRPIHVAHPEAVDSQPFCAYLFHLSGCWCLQKMSMYL